MSSWMMHSGASGLWDVMACRVMLMNNCRHGDVSCVIMHHQLPSSAKDLRALIQHTCTDHAAMQSASF